MNSINDSKPDFGKEVLVKLNNGLFAVARFNRVEADGRTHEYFTVGKAIAGNDPHLTGSVVEWANLY